MLPTRLAAPVLAATLKVTVPFPAPPDPLAGKVIHVTLLPATQVQSLALGVTTKLPVPAAGAKYWLVGASEKVQATPDWVTMNVCPAMVTVPVRVRLLVLPSTV